MVGGLVEKQQIGLAHERAAQRCAAAAAPGQMTHEGIGWQLQAVDHTVDAMLKGPAVAGLDLALQLGHEVELTRIAPVDAVGIAVGHCMVAAQQVAQLVQASGYVVVHRLVAQRRQVLVQIGHPQAASLPQFAAVWQCLATEQLHEAGLAGAVLAQDADALALVNGEIDPIQQGFVAIGEGEVRESVQQHWNFQRERRIVGERSVGGANPAVGLYPVVGASLARELTESASVREQGSLPQQNQLPQQNPLHQMRSLSQPGSLPPGL